MEAYIISAAQEMDRAGRDGLPTDFVIYQPAMKPFTVRDQFEDFFKETTCYRQCLNKLMDGMGEVCTQQDQTFQLCARRYNTAGSILAGRLVEKMFEDQAKTRTSNTVHVNDLITENLIT